MEVVNTALKPHIDEIVNSDGAIDFSYTATIHYGNATMKPTMIVALNKKCDYVEDYAPVITITLLIPLGKYAKVLYPYRAYLQMTLEKNVVNKITGQDSNGTAPEKERFVAVLNAPGEAISEYQGKEGLSEEALDRLKMLEVSFQLLPIPVHICRMVETGNPYRDNTVTDVICGILVEMPKNIMPGYPAPVAGVSMMPAQNQVPIKHLVIPPKTKLVDVPKMIQSRYGVYTTGLGSFVKDNYWYIYSIFNTSLFNKTKKTLTLVIAPPNKYGFIEKTYRLKADSLHVLITGDTAYVDDSDTQYMNHGDGVTFVDPEKQLQNIGVASGNKVTADKSLSVNSVVVNKRQDGMTAVPGSTSISTSNIYMQMTKLAARGGGLLKTIWQNSDPSLLYPGMPVKIINSAPEGIIESYGVLSGDVSVIHNAGGITTNRQISTTVLYVFVRK